MWVDLIFMSIFFLVIMFFNYSHIAQKRKKKYKKGDFVIIKSLEEDVICRINNIYQDENLYFLHVLYYKNRKNKLSSNEYHFFKSHRIKRHATNKEIEFIKKIYSDIF